MIEDVKEFHQKFDMIVSNKPTPLSQKLLDERIVCMSEELDEFAEAVIDKDFAGQADALIDLVYFALGTAAMMGLPWKELWDDVHRANMAKVRGMTKRGHTVDVTKPLDWIAPQTRIILNDAGYVTTTQEVDYER